MELSCSPDSVGILSFLWPDLPLYKDVVPLADSCVGFVFYSDAKLPDHLSGRTDIVRVGTSGGIRLDSREGIVEFFKGKGVCFSESRSVYLSQLEGEQFFREVKILSLAHIPRAKEEEVITYVRILDNLFKGFKVSYPLYRKSGLHYKAIVSALLTMMSKVERYGDPSHSPNYRDVLYRSVSHLTKFKQSIVDYVDSDMGEADFLEFLFKVGEL